MGTSVIEQQFKKQIVCSIEIKDENRCFKKEEIDDQRDSVNYLNL